MIYQIHRKLIRLGLQTALLLSLLPTSFSAMAGPAHQALRAGLMPLPCQLLRGQVSYVFPDYVMMGAHSRRLPSMPVNGFAYHKTAWTNLNGPIGMQSIEYQVHKPGEKIIITPYVDEDDGNRAIAWVVWGVEKKYQNLGWYDTATGRRQTDNANQPITYGVITNKEQRRQYKLARQREDFWVMAGSRTRGYQTPYLQTVFHRDINIPVSDTPGDTSYAHGVNAHYYVYEQCYIKQVVPTDYIHQTVLPNSGMRYCRGEDYSGPSTKPRCLADMYLSGQAASSRLNAFTQGIKIIPGVGTAIQIQECLESSDPYCWGEAAVMGLTDVATLVVPLARAASASSYSRVAAIGNIAKKSQGTLLGLTAAGQGTLGAIDFARGEELKALLRFVGAGFDVYQFSRIAMGAGKVGSVKKIGETKPPTKPCHTAEITGSPKVCTSSSNCCAATAEIPNSFFTNRRAEIAMSDIQVIHLDGTVQSSHFMSKHVPKYGGMTNAEIRQQVQNIHSQLETARITNPSVTNFIGPNTTVWRSRNQAIRDVKKLLDDNRSSLSCLEVGGERTLTVRLPTSQEVLHVTRASNGAGGYNWTSITENIREVRLVVNRQSNTEFVIVHLGGTSP